MKKNIAIERLLRDEQKWRRRRTIADNHLAAIHAEMRIRLTDLTKQRDVIAEAVMSTNALPPAPTKGRKTRKLDLTD